MFLLGFLWQDCCDNKKGLLTKLNSVNCTSFDVNDTAFDARESISQLVP